MFLCILLCIFVVMLALKHTFEILQASKMELQRTQQDLYSVSRFLNISQRQYKQLEVVLSRVKLQFKTADELGKKIKENSSLVEAENVNLKKNLNAAAMEMKEQGERIKELETKVTQGEDQISQFQEELKINDRDFGLAKGRMRILEAKLEATRHEAKEKLMEAHHSVRVAKGEINEMKRKLSEKEKASKDCVDVKKKLTQFQTVINEIKETEPVADVED